MFLVKLSLTVLAVCALVYNVQGFTPCAMNGFLQGQWGVWTSADNVNYENKFNVTITSDAMFNFYLQQFPTLMYFCFDYDGTGKYIAFGSPETQIFNQYTVRIYFCWHLIKIDEYNYYVLEGTRAVQTNSDEHAKAYLVNGTLTPSQSTICEVTYNPEAGLSAPYKQLRKIITLNWGDTK
ncbi:hypothetical protein PoB_002090200 [Plakobranchus ocellatus]|uniref:Lipocalin/cytosolic fatty-acid binding domain-containing protein n=1 Tax=Plakobranchus ocellatus TaxID=259542 RepID=A0AAV3ZGG2_9GAST|nr:hypothetical protein PoB_002090200 [Plakobranchus ocellatus]